ncbi:MAG: hypothetical protein ACKO1K_00700 [Burkholderiales bacterium]
MKLRVKILPAAVAGALAASMYGPAFAQQPTPKADEKTEAVTVTGSRIKSPGVISNSPISSVGEAEIRSSQPVAVEEFVKLLPSAIPAVDQDQ